MTRGLRTLVMGATLSSLGCGRDRVTATADDVGAAKTQHASAVVPSVAPVPMERRKVPFLDDAVDESLAFPIELDIPVGWKMEKHVGELQVAFFAPQEPMSGVTISALECEPGESTGKCAERWKKIMRLSSDDIELETEGEVRAHSMDGKWRTWQRWVLRKRFPQIIDCSASSRDEGAMAARRWACSSMKVPECRPCPSRSTGRVVTRDDAASPKPT